MWPAAAASPAACAPKAPSFLRCRRFYPPPTWRSRLHGQPVANSHPYLDPVRLRILSSRKRAIRCSIGANLSGEGIGGNGTKDLRGFLSLDAFLSMTEMLCIVPPAIFSIGCLIGSALPGAAKPFQISLGNKFFACQYFLLVAAVVTGGLLRWRQWQRFYCVNEKGVSVDFIGRIEKVEEDLQSSVTIIRMLSRQLEKLSIRFRVTRKAIKEPIAKTAALAQKNFEATRALAMQEDVLEKELGEIQKVLLAMQEQQQKQLELILAIGKAGKLLDDKQDIVPGGRMEKNSTSIPEKSKSATVVGGNNDRA